MQAYLAEFVGTAILILFGNGVVANVVLSKTKGQGGGWIVITAGWAFGVAMAVYAVGRVSGAHINPAVTIALASTGVVEWAIVPGYLLAQLAGGFAGSVLVYLAYLGHWEHTEDADLKLACHCTAPGVRRMVPAFITEFIGTATLLFGVLVFGSLVSGAGSEPDAWTAAVQTFMGPALVGLLVFGIGLSLGGPTGYAINPARDLGPRLAHAVLPIAGKRDSDWSYAWVPIVAPILGGITGAWLFSALNF